MEPLTVLIPKIRVANTFDFPKGGNDSASNRTGYCYAFHLINGGKGTIVTPGKAYSVQKGDLIYLPPGVLHSFLSDSKHPLSTYNIYCDLRMPLPPNTHQHLYWNSQDFDPTFLTEIHPDPAIDQLSSHVPLQHHETLVAILKHMVNHYERAEALSEQLANHLLSAFLLELIQLSETKRFTDYRIKPILALIDQEANAGRHFETWITISGLKKTQFHDLFKKATGLSPKAYWTRAIMKQAAASLMESNRSITDIASDFGYSSIHHFTKQFKAYFGVAPSVYRNRKE